MFSQTRRAIQDFDNQHDFERMCADVLNGLGYSHVEPMAPGGGPDSGQDIKFAEGEVPGIAFVTLDKGIRDKFRGDLAKQSDVGGLIILFCNVDVSPRMKLEFSTEAMAKGYRLEIIDLERLRSLLDSSMKDVRRRYLKIDDEVAAQLRSDVSKLLRFPAAIPDAVAPATFTERHLSNQLPRRLFDLLMRYEESDVVEVPGIGAILRDHLSAYYGFREDVLKMENDLLPRIGQIVTVEFPSAWNILLNYVVMRFGGLSKGAIVSGGNFLNYGITWDEAERVFVQLSQDTTVSSKISALFALHEHLAQTIPSLAKA
jgi:hypothetical protein